MSAIISPCGKYRYRLEREGPGEGATAIIMVNPSTADAENDDRTISKLRGFGLAREGDKTCHPLRGPVAAYRIGWPKCTSGSQKSAKIRSAHSCASSRRRSR